MMSGSEIAKGGFRNEQEVVDKFNNWKQDIEAQRWLQIMMYNLKEVVSVHAEKIGQKGFKSDINVEINIIIIRKNNNTRILSVENIQVKLVSSLSGYNQVEKKKVGQYVNMWHIPEHIVRLLEYYDGEKPPYLQNTKKNNRMFITEFSANQQADIINFFQKNIIMIVSDVIRGRGRFAAEWILVINKYKGYRWVLISINEAIGIYLGDCKAIITSTGNIKLGNITLQRKGGDNGKPTANMLQFKADPMILFNSDTRKNSSDNWS